jgi:hypothetical protein
MKASREFLSGLAAGTLVGSLLAAWVENSAPSVKTDACVNQAPDDLKEHYDQVESRLASTMADFDRKLSSVQERHERYVALLDERQRSVAVELRRLRILVTWTVILSCFGVVAFTIVLFLAYVKY